MRSQPSPTLRTASQAVRVTSSLVVLAAPSAHPNDPDEEDWDEDEPDEADEQGEEEDDQEGGWGDPEPTEEWDVMRRSR